VLELRSHADKNILKDKDVAESIKEIEKLDAEIEDVKKKTSEISKIEE